MPFITINQGGWDTHENNFNSLKKSRLPELDQGYAALLKDLDARGIDGGGAPEEGDRILLPIGERGGGGSVVETVHVTWVGRDDAVEFPAGGIELAGGVVGEAVRVVQLGFSATDPGASQTHRPAQRRTRTHRAGEQPRDAVLEEDLGPDGDAGERHARQLDVISGRAVGEQEHHCVFRPRDAQRQRQGSRFRSSLHLPQRPPRFRRRRGARRKAELLCPRQRSRPLERDRRGQGRLRPLRDGVKTCRDRAGALGRRFDERAGGAVLPEHQQRQARRFSFRLEKFNGRRSVLAESDQGLLVDDRSPRRLLGKRRRHPPFRAAENGAEQRETAHRAFLP